MAFFLVPERSCELDARNPRISRAACPPFRLCRERGPTPCTRSLPRIDWGVRWAELGRRLTDEEMAPLDLGSTRTRGNVAGSFIIPPSEGLERSDPPSTNDFHKLVFRGMHQRTRRLLFDFTAATLAVSMSSSRFLRPSLKLLVHDRTIYSPIHLHN